jgi:hypothetical protein
MITARLRAVRALSVASLTMAKRGETPSRPISIFRLYSQPVETCRALLVSERLRTVRFSWARDLLRRRRRMEERLWPGCSRWRTDIRRSRWTKERWRCMCGRRRHIRSGWRLMKPALAFAAASLMFVPFVTLVVATPPTTEIPEPQPKRRRLLIIPRRVAIGRVVRGIAVGLNRLRIARDIPVGPIRLQIFVGAVVTTAQTQGGGRQCKMYFQSHDD